MAFGKLLLGNACVMLEALPCDRNFSPIVTNPGNERAPDYRYTGDEIIQKAYMKGMPFREILEPRHDRGTHTYQSRPLI